MRTYIFITLSRLQVWSAASPLQQHRRPTTEARSRLVTPPASISLAARRRGLRLDLRQADADALPFADESFASVLSGNVIFHGMMSDVGRRLAESWRVLKPGGLYQDTMLSKCDGQFGRGLPAAPVRRPVGPVRRIRLRSGVESPLARTAVMVARGGRWLVIAIRRELPQTRLARATAPARVRRVLTRLVSRISICFAG